MTMSCWTKASMSQLSIKKTMPTSCKVSTFLLPADDHGVIIIHCFCSLNNTQLIDISRRQIFPVVVSQKQNLSLYFLWFSCTGSCRVFASEYFFVIISNVLMKWYQKSLFVTVTFFSVKAGLNQGTYANYRL